MSFTILNNQQTTNILQIFLTITKKTSRRNTSIITAQTQNTKTSHYHTSITIKQKQSFTILIIILTITKKIFTSQYINNNRTKQKILHNPQQQTDNK